jgi:hypothetical protein
MTTLTNTIREDLEYEHPAMWMLAIPALTQEQITQLREHVLRLLHHAGEEVV